MEVRMDKLGVPYQEMFPGTTDPYAFCPSYQKLMTRLGELFDCDIDFGEGEEK